MFEKLVRIGWAFQELSFEFSVGAETPYYGGCMWPAMPIFELGRAIPVKSHMWKFRLDWLSLSRVIVYTNIFLWGKNPLLVGGYMWPVMPIFELGRSCLDKSHVWKFVSDWLRLSRVIVGTNQMDTRTQTKTKIFKVRCRSVPYLGA